MKKRTLQENYHLGEGNLTPPGTFKINHKFNRIEYIDHAYRAFHGTEPLGDSEYEGVIKCKLIYTEEFELIIPNLIYIENQKDELIWFQFYNFIPGTFEFDNNYRFNLALDISGGHTIIISFEPKDFIRKLSDNSNLYNCKIKGPHKIEEFSNGTGKTIDGIPFIYLYQHTKPEFKEMIQSSERLKGSKWNYQGNKRIKNLEYCYFTNIDKIKKPLDLKMIAMATNERILAIVDTTLERIPIKIPRQSTTDRKATIEFLIDTTLIANDHITERIYDKADIKNINNSDYFYTMCFPYIFRVGIVKDTFIKIDPDYVIRKCTNNVVPNYIILGKGYDREAVTAPYDEENTKFIGKIFPLSDLKSEDAITTNIRLISRRKEIYNSLKVEYLIFDDEDKT